MGNIYHTVPGGGLPGQRLSVAPDSIQKQGLADPHQLKKQVKKTRIAVNTDKLKKMVMEP